MKALPLAALIVSSLAVSTVPARGAIPELSGQGFIDREEPCRSTDTLVPENHEAPVVGDYATKVVLDVAVLLVGVEPEMSDEIMTEVAEVYAPLGIEVKWVNEAVNLEIDPPPDNSALGTVLSTSESGAYIEASKEHFGGERPWWADVVYTMIDGELSSSVAGQADCVGGIVYPDSAFAVGEVDINRRISRSSKIAGHEIAHLLAAHHHFANCAEGNKQTLTQDGAPCTLMFNDVGLISLAFSTLEGAVVRDYALEYANETPTSEPTEKPWDGETVERSVTLKIDSHRVASGKVATSPRSAVYCSYEVPVRLERKAASGWEPVRDGKTDEESTFRFRVRSSGRYRVAAPEYVTDFDSKCAAATSRSTKTP